MAKSVDNLELRKACASDVAAIRHCATEAYSQYVERIGKKPAPMVADFGSLVADGKMVVAINNASEMQSSAAKDMLVGYVVFYADNNTMRLDNIAVLPQCTGAGIGKLLIATVEQSAQGLGLDSVTLYTNASMIENLQMYPALGYVEFDRRVEDGFNRVYYRKRV